MEKFYDFMRKKYFIDYGDEEIKDISKAMHTFLRKLSDIFNESSEVLKIEQLVHCGSMEEKTTVLREENSAVEYDPSKNIETIEFDCLAVLKHIVPDLTMEPSCPGYRKLTSNILSSLLEEKMHIELSEPYQKALSCHTKNVLDTLRFLLLSKDDADVDDDDSTVVDGTAAGNTKAIPVSFDVFLSQEIAKKLESGESVSIYKDLLRLHKYVSGTSKCFSTEFMIAVDSAAEAMCQSSDTRCEFDKDMPVYVVEMPTGTLQYGRCLPGCQLAFLWKSKVKPTAEKVIYADFVPAFEVPGTSALSDNPPNYLVAKGCRTPDCESGCWRLSHCLAEIKAIQTTSQDHRDIYKFLKIFNYSPLSRRADNALKSYHIKTALLTHLKNCKETTVDISDCLIKTLDIVNNYIKYEKVPHWKDPNYTLILKLDTCHGIIPLLLKFVFDTAVQHAPKRCYLTIRCNVRDKDIFYYKAGSKLSNLVCEVIEGKECYEGLENEIESTLLHAADLCPWHGQTSVKYSLIVERQDNQLTIYQRCQDS